MLLPKEILEEYQAARQSAALFDFSNRSKVELRGKDRVPFLQNFCTNDVAKLQPGQSCEAFLTTAQAKIVAHLRIFATDESLWLDADPGLAPKIISHLDRFLITEQVEMADRSQEFAQFHLLNTALLEGRGKALIIRPNPFLSPTGFDVLCANDIKEAVRQDLLAHGARPISPGVFEILRVEAGWPRYGQDIDETNLPQEVNRDERAISFTKGCYLGQETVARIKAYGHVNRLLVGVKFSTMEPPPPGTALSPPYEGGGRGGASAQDVGKITSSVFSPSLGTAIVLALVRRGHNDVGTVLEVVGTGPAKFLSATVQSLPFVESTAPTHSPR